MIDRINQRVSYHAHDLSEPAPSQAQVQQILSVLTSTPDHGNLTPWDVLIIERAQIDNFCDAMLSACAALSHQEQPGHARRLISYIKQSPMLVVVSAKVTVGHAVSEMDQVLSAAAACQNILLAADSLGVGAIWYSADVLSSVKPSIGLAASDRPVGLLVLGTVTNSKTKLRSDATQFCRHWPLN